MIIDLFSSLDFFTSAHNGGQGNLQAFGFLLNRVSSEPEILLHLDLISYIYLRISGILG